MRIESAIPSLIISSVPACCVMSLSLGFASFASQASAAGDAKGAKAVSSPATTTDKSTSSTHKEQKDQKETNSKKSAAPVKKEARNGNPRVKITTSMGVIEAELFPKEAPISVKNFIAYASDKFYDKTIFHRVMDGFMIQGGGFDASMKQKETKEPIKNEANNGLSNTRGTIAMARTYIPDSATAQFYINLVDNQMLDYTPTNAGYAVFGKVTHGMDVVDAIGKVRTGKFAEMSDVPVKAVTIESIRLEK